MAVTPAALSQPLLVAVCDMNHPDASHRQALVAHLQWSLEPAQLGEGLAVAVVDLPPFQCSNSALQRLRSQLRAVDQLFDYDRPRIAFVFRHIHSVELATAILGRILHQCRANPTASCILITHHWLDANEWLADAEHSMQPANDPAFVIQPERPGVSVDTPLMEPSSVALPNTLAELPTEALSDQESYLPAQTMEIILDNIDAYIFIKGPDRIYRYANLPLEGLYGSSRDQIIGRDDSAFHHGESLQALWRNDDLVMESDKPLFAEEQVFDQAGNEGWYMSRKMPISLPGYGRCLLGMAIDITQSKLAMAGLARSEAKFRSLFEASLDAVGVIDAFGNIREINDAALKMFGCADRDYFLTLKPADLSPSHQPDGRPSDQAADEQIAIAVQKGSHEFDWIHHRLDTGEEFLVNVCMSAIEIDGMPAILTRERDISLERGYEERLKHLAFTDQLTGLANYQGAVEWFVGSAAPVSGGNLLVLAFDIDEFHRFNQAYGREVGNEILLAFASALKSAIRPEMLVARLQADEFLLFAPLFTQSVAGAELESLAEATVIALRQAIDRGLRDSLDEPWQLPSYSCGATVCEAQLRTSPSGSSQRDIDRLLLEVNVAIKQAVRRGTGQTVFFRQSMLETSQEEVRIEAELTQAIASGRLCIHYQPIVDRFGSIVAAEALMRYCLEDGGLVYPDRFIPLAERKGHITPLGEQLVESTCRQLADWLRLGLPIQYLSLNLSPAQLRDGGVAFSQFLLAVLGRYDLKPEMIQLEITETAVLDDPGRIDDVLLSLAEMGFKLAIDDFGTGYSSLATLQRLPFTTLKIDKTFVKGMTRHSKSRDLVQACVSIARNLRLRCVAEGVDSEPDCEMLMRLGCDHFQGFLFDPGLEASVLERRLLDQMQALEIPAL